MVNTRGVHSLLGPFRSAYIFSELITNKIPSQEIELLCVMLWRSWMAVINMVKKTNKLLRLMGAAFKKFNRGKKFPSEWVIRNSYVLGFGRRKWFLQEKSNCATQVAGWLIYFIAYFACKINLMKYKPAKCYYCKFSKYFLMELPASYVWNHFHFTFFFPFLFFK